MRKVEHTACIGDIQNVGQKTQKEENTEDPGRDGMLRRQAMRVDSSVTRLDSVANNFEHGNES
jgi:hypothetical protein